MKDFLFLTPRITNLGGAQLYTARRANYLKEKGFNVIVLTYDFSGSFILEEKFANIKSINISELEKPCYTLFDLRQKVLFIIEELDLSENVIIESHTLELSIWGEFIANYFKYKHIVYLLDIVSLNKSPYFNNLEFLKFKNKRHELIGVARDFNSVLLKKEIVYNDYVNIGFDTEEIYEKSFPSVDIIKEEDVFYIGTICRLEKKYLEPMIKSVLDFTPKKHRKVSLLIAGGTHSESVRSYLEEKYRINSHNLEINFIGYLNPMGKDFFNILDVFVGQGTTILNASSMAIPSIVVETDDDRCNGFFGRDTLSFAYTKDKVRYKLIDKLAYLEENMDKRESVGKLAYDLFVSEFNLDYCQEKMDKYYELTDDKQYLISKSIFRPAFNFVTYNLIKLFLHVKHYGKNK